MYMSFRGGGSLLFHDHYQVLMIVRERPEGLEFVRERASQAAARISAVPNMHNKGCGRVIMLINIIEKMNSSVIMDELIHHHPHLGLSEAY